VSNIYIMNNTDKSHSDYPAELIEVGSYLIQC